MGGDGLDQPLGRRPEARPGVGTDGGTDPLTPPLVGQAEHGHLGDAGGLAQHRLDLGRIDVDPSGDDQVVAAAVEEEVAVRRAARGRRR